MYTEAIEEMTSPLCGVPTYAKTNVNGFLSSILAWLQGSGDMAEERDFEGYRIWTKETLDRLNSMELPNTCRSALTEVIRRDNQTEMPLPPSI